MSAAVLGGGRVSQATLARWANLASSPAGRGFAVVPTTGADVRSGFPVVVSDRCQVIGDRVRWWDVMAYVRGNWSVLCRPGAVLRGWHDPDAGVSYLDVSRVGGRV